MGLSLADLLSKFDRHVDSIPLDQVVSGLTELKICVDEVSEFVQFGNDSYRRNLIHAGSAYQALILCWRPGQRSPIHDHLGSACGVRVLRGIASETVFARNPAGLIFPTVTRERREGEICGSFDSDIHQVSNLQSAGDNLVTLHVYSPALLVMNTYSLTDKQFEKFVLPVREFVHGAGI